MPKALRSWEAFHVLKKEIDDFQTVLPLLVELKKDSIMPRHWQHIMELTGTELQVDADDFKVSSLISADLHVVADEITDITDSADKQLKVEQAITDIAAMWTTTELLIVSAPPKHEHPIRIDNAKYGEVLEALEESLQALSTMNTQRHSLPFREELGALLSKLSDTVDTLEKWWKVQSKWTSLEAVFTSGDIAKQLAQDAKRFQQIDKDWAKIMFKSHELKFVVACCQNDLLKQLLPSLSDGLELCERSLKSYLDKKRLAFPRFYFTSDPVLLKILSNGSDPEAIQDEFEKLFDAVSAVQFDKGKGNLKITAIKSVAGMDCESVPLVSHVACVGNIEDWLSELERSMQKSIRSECQRVAGHSSVHSFSDVPSVQELFDVHFGQTALLGIQLIWTRDFQDALVKKFKEKDNHIMMQTNKKFFLILDLLVKICLTDVSKTPPGGKLTRTKYETLVTIHVHQRDIFQETVQKVKKHEVNGPGDFEWLKQTRFYWKDTQGVVISIADVDFVYSNEYLGIKERLCITPLTDRCYLALSQALGMYYGGAPAGPAGTGKTETTKDMGRSLGIFVVVTNCSDQHRSKDMAKIFKGLCMSGLWGCFDEFNRIDLEVLSVVAMQVEAITDAKKKTAATFLFPGEKDLIALRDTVGYFITMNPGYAGRQELPENIKVLFRGVTMMVPDRQIIMRVKLASQGYLQMDLLGKKFKILYDLCEQQLSKQRHYDFGLRNILSVLRTCGAVKRDELLANDNPDEEMLFMRTARDMNLSKLVADDVPLFLALLKDLFPTISDPPQKVYKDVESKTKEIITRNHLDHCPSWMKKVIQLYETSLVRHGFMTVGPTLCGKSTIINTLTTALTENGSPHKVFRMNPKAITDQQMYGNKDPISEEWTPGVFSSIWAKYNDRRHKWTSWITCDGPVDAIWIENLNTVLDDNKMLTLANGDRFPMTENCKIVFEVENLNNASPATVSRAGIIAVSLSDLGWQPMYKAWLLSRSEIESNRAKIAEAEVSALDKLVSLWITKEVDGCQDLLEWVNRHVPSVMVVNDSVKMSNVFNLLSATLATQDGQPCNEVLDEKGYARVFLYSLAWGLGGLCDSPERSKLWNKLRQIVVDSKMGDVVAVIDESLSVFEYFPEPDTARRFWKLWKPNTWAPPAVLPSFSSLLIPTMDSMRAEELIKRMAVYDCSAASTPPCFRSSMILGASGTAKTSTVLMYCSKFDLDAHVAKRVNFSSATQPLGFQKTIDEDVERKTGRTFQPPAGKKMTVFIDDVSMPLVNKWGDQITNEFCRQLMEQQGYYFLDKDKRGDFKTIENLTFIGAMNHPGGGKNDIPSRLKSKFFSFNMVLPSITSVESIYGAVLKARFTKKQGARQDVIDLVNSGALTNATIDVWNNVKRKLLPTPARFHYTFNMRELSRIFQQIFSTPVASVDSPIGLVRLWKHEVTRVLADKLCREQDIEVVTKELELSGIESFGSNIMENSTVSDEPWYADFQRECKEDEETGEELPNEQVYEVIPSLEFVREKAYEYLKKFNDQFPAMVMNLVLFDDAVKYLMRINRTIQQDRGSAMLVGVGGSGKKSLTRLATFISRHKLKQIVITKQYSEKQLIEEDFRYVYKGAATEGHKVPYTFLFTDAEIKQESFLELFNMFLSTGDVTGCITKEERQGMAGETRNEFKLQNPHLEDSATNLTNFLMDRIRDKLHVVFGFSPVSAQFPIRAQKFPAVFSQVNIIWFTAWPKEALINVAGTLLGDFDLETTPQIRSDLYGLMGSIQAGINTMCDRFLKRMRRYVYVTPKSFLCFISFYKQLYREKHTDLKDLQSAVDSGLEKLAKAEEDVALMTIDLEKQDVQVREATKQTEKVLVKVQAQSAEAEKKMVEVNGKKTECLAEKTRIDGEKETAEKELAKAMPFVHQAEAAANSIKPADITELKQNNNPGDIIKLTMDLVIILFQGGLTPVKAATPTINKIQFSFIVDSYSAGDGQNILKNMNFLKNLMTFNQIGKDRINDETVEFMESYLPQPDEEEDPTRIQTFIVPKYAKKASGAAEGLCSRRERK